MRVDISKVIDDLVCPKSRSELVFDAGNLVCSDPQCRLLFEVMDNIPRLVIEDARELGQDEWRIIMQRHESQSENTPPHSLSRSDRGFLKRKMTGADQES